LLVVCGAAAILAACGGGGGDSDTTPTVSVAYGYLPKANCSAEDLVETALQGQVPQADRLSGRAARGYNCNLNLVGHHADSSFANMDSYKNCVYYTNNRGGRGATTGQGGPADGVGVVLDVSDPTKPVVSAQLTAWAMKNAGESLRVNQKRGLLVADYYNLGSLAVYDVSGDCRSPVLLADIKTMPRAIGHEGCFSPDGMVYYMANLSTMITPIDISDPSNPKELTAPWAMSIHGCSISDDGKTGYFSEFGFAPKGNLQIVDVSQAQARQPDAGFSIIGTFPTTDGPGQQSSYPLTYNGKPYLFNWSELGPGLGKTDVCGAGLPTNFGFARMIDVSDPAKPREVSQFKLEVHDPANCAVFKSDRGPQVQGLAQGDTFWQGAPGVFLYDTHYCRPDRLHNPTVMGCAGFGSGLRIWDIRDPAHPREIAYYNTGTVDVNGTTVLDYAVSPPVFRRDLGQVWWVTLYGGFYAAKFKDGVWPSKDDNKCVDGYDYFADQYDSTYCRSTWNK